MPSFDVVLATDPASMADRAAGLVREAIAGADPSDLRPWPVLVPSLPLRDHLRAALAARLRVCAGLDILLPDEFLRRWLPQRLGLPPGPDPAATPWRIARLLPDGDGPWDARRWSLAGRTGDALLRCALWAPEETTAAWQTGAAGAWDDEVPWLPGLWRSLAAEEPGVDPNHLSATLIAAVRQARDLPPLVLAYGTNALAPGMIALLAALAERTAVRAVLLHPSGGDLGDQPTSRQAVRDGLPAHQRHRLLGDWAVEHRHALVRLDNAGAGIYPPEPDPVVPRTLLQRLRADLREGRPPAEAGPWTLAPDDHSLRFEHAYGARASLEGLKRRLAAIFAAPDAPAPHEVCIAIPDPAAMAPLLAAVFAASGDGPALPVDLRAPLAGAPALDTAARLLALLPGRWNAPEVLDLCASAAVESGHGIGPDDLDRLRGWCDEADLRFGVDAAHRAALGLGSYAGASWRRGLQRLALAAWLGADAGSLPAWPDPADLPLPATGGLDEADVAALERIAGLLLPLLDAAAAWRQPQVPAWWAAQVPAQVAHVRDSADDDPALDLARRFADWAATCERLGLALQPLRAEVVAALVESWTAGGGAVRGGGIAVGTPAALRCQPWRVVCLAGFDDGAFPRQNHSDVDLVARHPRQNGHDPRSEDRASLLDLIIACRDHLLLSWSGHDPASGEETPPATVVGDLWEVVRATCGMDEAGLRTRLWHDAGIIGALAAGRSGEAFPAAALRDQAAALADAARVAETELRPAPAPVRDDVIELDDLLAFVRDPARAYLLRLGVRLPEEDEDPAEHERFAIAGGLDAWQLRHEAIDATGADAAVLARWAAAGRIPAGAIGAVQARRVLAEGRALAAASAADWAVTTADAHAIGIRLDDGRRVTGAIARIHPELGPLARHPGEDRAKHRQRAWLLGLAWQAQGGRGGGALWHQRKGKAHRSEFAAAENARERLADLVAWRDRALATPTALLPEVCASWAAAAAAAGASDGDAEAAGLATAQALWASELNGLARLPALRRLWPRPADPFAGLDPAQAAADVQAGGVWSWGVQA